MKHALAVVGPTEGAKQLVREAGELAAGVGADLTLVHVTTDEEFAEKNAAMESVPEMDVSYSIDQARDGAKAFAGDIGREVLHDVDVEWEAMGRLGPQKREILDEAETRGCDHLFVAGRKRSPAGKAVFGDLAQDLILEFDGAVTVIAEKRE